MAIHTGEEPILFAKCGDQFNTMYEMDKQMLIHTGEKSSVQEKHVLTQEGEVIPSCTYCDNCCLNKDVLSNHLILHDVFSCVNCDYKSNSAQVLSENAKEHTK